MSNTFHLESLSLFTATVHFNPNKTHLRRYENNVPCVLFLPRPIRTDRVDLRRISHYPRQVRAGRRHVRNIGSPQRTKSGKS